MVKQYKVKIEKIIPQTNDTNAYVLVPVGESDGLFDYNVGQFYMLQADLTRQNREGKDVQETDKRAYSIVSNPLNREYVELLIKVDFPKKDWENKSAEERKELRPPFAEYFMEQHKAGDECVLIGPNGRFLKPVFDNNEEYVAYWYSGSGIPSGLSLCEYVLQKGLRKKIILFGSNKTAQDVIYHERIKKLVESSASAMRFVCTLTRENIVEIPQSIENTVIYRTGRFWSGNENTFQKYAGSDARKYHHAICGSSSFISGTTRSRKDGRMIKGICKNETCRKEFGSVRDRSGNLIKTCDNCGGEIDVFRGMKNRLIEVGVEEKSIEIDQFYLH